MRQRNLSNTKHSFMSHLVNRLIGLAGEVKTDAVEVDDMYTVKYYGTSDEKQILRYTMSMYVEKINGVDRLQVCTMQVLFNTTASISKILTEHSIPLHDFETSGSRYNVTDALLVANSDKVVRALAGEEVHWQ